METKSANIEFLGHSGFLITFHSLNGDKRIAIDPYNIMDKIDKVDYILITHSHYDHCSIKDIQKLVKKGTVIVIPADAQSKITRIEGIEMQVVESGDKADLQGIKMEVLPPYNLNKNFHPKSEGWVGYLLKYKDLIIYHAGDTDNIPEMQKLSGYGKHGNEFIVLLPVSGKYVMNASDAAEAASLLNPDLAVPMHYGAGVAGELSDAEEFVRLCKEMNIKAEILEKI